MGPLKSARPSDVAAVVDGIPAVDTVVVVALRGATVMVVVIAGGRDLRVTVAVATRRAHRANTLVVMGGRSTVVIGAMATAMAMACRITLAVASVASRSTRVVAPMATVTACRINTVAATAKANRLNTRIIRPIAAMVALAADRTLNVTLTVAVVKHVPGSLPADSRRVAVAAGSGIAQAADAPADDAKRRGGHYEAGADASSALTRDWR
jgi:hypothetical protein